MRKFLILSALIATAGAAGCTHDPCGRPTCSLFGSGRQNNAYQNYGYQNYGYQQPGCCCDSSSGGYTSYGATEGVMMAPTAAPVMTPQAPCCQ